jgi:ribosomal protein RSM22 (predicted rRNA methylase)
MQLPDELQRMLEQEIEMCSHGSLLRAFERMTKHYRSEKNSGSLFMDPAVRAVYLAVRMPATYAAIRTVFKECAMSLPDWQPRTMVDIGAGPGTGGWAALEQFSSLQSLCNVELSREMIEVGQRLSRESESRVLREAAWVDPSCIFPADLTLLSYVIAEMTQTARRELLTKTWNQNSRVFVVIEPGTPAGFQRILEVRDWALGQGAHLIAPCPHCTPCPMSSPAWCHFPARVDRTRLHKLLKGGTLGYEDEKFSYLAFGKIPVQFPVGRVVGNPKKNKGFVQIPLCINGASKEVVVSRKQNEYRLARDVEYGDAWNPGH